MTSSDIPSKKRKIDPKPWYQNIPKDEAIDDSVFKEPMAKILKSIASELGTLSIDHIVAEYQPIMSEFYELSAPYRAFARNYNEIFEAFLEKICKIYNITREDMYVQTAKYSTSDWGKVYWEFLHLSSILLSHAFETGLVDSLLGFPTLVYNIDGILPCSRCAHHYAAIKEGDDMKQVIKSMAFGSTMVSLQIFHNIVTANVDKTPDYANRPNRERFLLSDFALKYKCIDVQDENFKLAKDYVKSCIDWQPTTHVLFCIILSTYCSQPSFDRASNLLKHHLYATHPAFGKSIVLAKNANIRALDVADLAYQALTAKQIQYCLVRALLLQFQDTAVSDDDLAKNVRLNYALVTIYKTFNSEMKTIVANSLPNEPDLKKTLLAKLDRVQSADFASIV